MNMNQANQETSVSQALRDCRNEIVSQLVALNVFAHAAGDSLESDLLAKQERLNNLLKEIVKAESIIN